MKDEVAGSSPVSHPQKKYPMKTPPFNFSKEQRDGVKQALQKYFADELEMELTNLQADLLLEFLNDEIGKNYYNLGVTDAIAAIKEKAEDLVLLVKE